MTRADHRRRVRRLNAARLWLRIASLFGLFLVVVALLDQIGKFIRGVA